MSINIPQSHTHSSEPPTKKRHLDDDDPAGPSSRVTRSRDLWFADGNIIFQVETTQFRIHRSIISSHSTVFEDMFMIPQPNEVTLLEDCPVIRVPDSAKDWENVLTVIYKSSKLYRELSDYKIDTIISMLELGVKYQIDHIRDTAVQALKASLPSSRSAWTKSNVKPNGYEVKLIEVASRVGLQSVLPVLYLMCLKRYSLDEILDDNGVGTQKVSFPRDVQKLLLRARDKLILRTTELASQSWEITDTEWLVDGECDPESCVPERTMAILFILRSPLQNVTFGLDNFRLPPGMGCEYCRLDDGFWHSSIAETLWNVLPSFFDLPDWETLCASDKKKFPNA